ncbi:cell division protein FtsA [Thermohalobacter berrensis]|uniref:Cell division protein FtsA n=1 Tax=Thermohalobacter berrensis TaxID=99594 RepID=A0A419TA16_9FIRM|nr:cell division protein FtsA [Thermohalobacter berrensis]RKD34305.1 cell division protein FtsA [Thermohalobacter berrensis]
MGDLITAIDLGTSKVCVMIAEIDEKGKTQIIGLGKSPCKGIKKGIVVDIEATTNSILEAVEQAENMADIEVEEAFINIPGGYTNLIKNKGVIAVSNEDREITMEDVKRVLNSATIVSIPQDQRIIDVVPNQYIIDGYDEIKDPIGMVGIRLEVDCDIITGSVTSVLNLVRSVNRSGIEVLGIIMEPLATSEAVLTRDEKELGVLLVDIGSGTTDLSLFKHGRLIYSNLIPVAGNHITNDISVGLRIPFKESEDIKKKHGLAYVPLAKEENVIEIKPISIDETIKVNEVNLAQIIEARISEIFELINSDIINKGIKNEILTGVVLTGGGVNYFNGIKELGSKIFGLPVRLGQPNIIGAKEPIFSTGVGLVNYGYKRKFNYYIEYNNVENKNSKHRKGFSTSKNVMNFIKKIWDEYF